MGVCDTLCYWWIRLLLRALQFGLCLVTLILLSSGFVVGSFNGHQSVLGGSNVMTTAMLTFLGLIYSLWWAILIELLRISPRPRASYAVIMDVIVALSLIGAAIVLLVSDFVTNCLSFGHLLRCTNLNATVVFAFLSALAFLLSPLLMLYWNREKQPAPRTESPRTPQHHEPYAPVSTPNARPEHPSRGTAV